MCNKSKGYPGHHGIFMNTPGKLGLQSRKKIVNPYQYFVNYDSPKQFKVVNCDGVRHVPDSTSGTWH